MQRYEFPFFYPFRIRYAEIDAQAVVFNAHYLTYFDTALTEYMRHLGFLYDMATIADMGKDFHVVKALVEYKAPIHFDDDIVVGTRPGRIGRSSVTFHLAIFANDEEAPRAIGEVVWVFTDVHTHRSTPLLPDFVAALHASVQQLPTRN